MYTRCGESGHWYTETNLSSMGKIHHNFSIPAVATISRIQTFKPFTSLHAACPSLPQPCQSLPKAHKPAQGVCHWKLAPGRQHAKLAKWCVIYSRAKCRYAGCRFADCRGAVHTVDLQTVTSSKAENCIDESWRIKSN